MSDSQPGTNMAGLHHPGQLRSDKGGEAEAIDAASKWSLLTRLRHDIRTPLNAIIGYTELLREEAQDLDEVRFLPDLRKIHAAATHLLQVINAILHPSKVVAGTMDLSHADHELRTPLNAIIGYTELLQEQARDLGEVRFLSDLHKVHAAGADLLHLISAVLGFLKDDAQEQDLEGRGGERDVVPIGVAIRSEIPDPVPARIEIDTANTPSKHASALIVDDDEVNRDLLSRWLERLGWRVVTAVDGYQALAVLKSHPVDLVLLDILMPIMSGFQVLDHLKSDASLCHIPVIVLSAFDSKDSIARCIELGAEDYLPKPFDPVVLQARIGSTLEKKRLRDQERAYLQQIEEEKRRSDGLRDQLEARNRLLYDALQRSVSAPVAARIVEDPERYLRPGGERRTVSILFADLRGYSTIAEELAPQQAMAVLNTYLGHIIDVIYRHGGTVNQLLGDGVMCLFGAPISYGDDAWRAVQAALDMREEIIVLEPPGLPHIRLSMGIGITTGEVVVGHIGSERRVDYTAVGDAVNLAARFQAHAGPGQILITRPTYDLVHDLVTVTDVGTQSVKGRLGWVQAYSVLGRLEQPAHPRLESP